jgi:hypothetical protein
MIRPLPDMEFSILKVSKHSICLDIMTTIYWIGK